MSSFFRHSRNSLAYYAMNLQIRRDSFSFGLGKCCETSVVIYEYEVETVKLLNDFIDFPLLLLFVESKENNV